MRDMSRIGVWMPMRSENMLLAARVMRPTPAYCKEHAVHTIPKKIKQTEVQ